MKTFRRFSVRLSNSSSDYILEIKPQLDALTIENFLRITWPKNNSVWVDENKGIAIPWHAVCIIKGLEDPHSP